MTISAEGYVDIVMLMIIIITIINEKITKEKVTINKNFIEQWGC